MRLRKLALELRSRCGQPGKLGSSLPRTKRRVSTKTPATENAPPPKAAPVVAIQPPKQPSTLLRVGLGTAAVAAVGFGYVVYDPTVIGHGEGEDVKVLAEAVVRGLRLLSTVALMIADYKLAPLQDSSYALPKDAELALDEAEKEIREAQNLYEAVGIALDKAQTKEDQEALTIKAKEARDWVLAAANRLSKVEEHAKGLSKKGQIHKRAATRLLELCQANGGAYIKIGQHISQLDYILPREYTETLQVLLNRAPVSSYEDVRAVLKEELGAYPEELWSQFEEKSIASASLAQVHVAYDKEGRKMAVKVQHRGLRETSRGDVAAMTFVINLVADLFPEFSYRWLAEEMAPQLAKELDFENEGRNAERAAQFFKGREDILIPKVYWDRTGARVLTMEYEDGCLATDVEEMRRQKLPLDKVARLITRVFSEQVYSSGWVHCDPHPGNVLIRPNPKRPGEPVMILLDHGLYKQLDDDFRLDYCRLWKALVFKDLEAVKYYCMKLNSGDMYSLLAAVLTNRSWDDIKDPSLGSLRTPNTKQDRTLIRTYAQKYLFEITEILNRVPRQMLLLLKTNDCLRHIDRELGSPVNASLIAAQECARALLREECKKGWSWRYWRGQAAAYWDFLMVKARIESFVAYNKWTQSRRKKVEGEEDEEGALEETASKAVISI